MPKMPSWRSARRRRWWRTTPGNWGGLVILKDSDMRSSRMQSEVTKKSSMKCLRVRDLWTDREGFKKRNEEEKDRKRVSAGTGGRREAQKSGKAFSSFQQRRGVCLPRLSRPFAKRSWEEPRSQWRWLSKEEEGLVRRWAALCRAKVRRSAVRGRPAFHLQHRATWMV